MKNTPKDQVLDLTDLFMNDPALANKIFLQAQRFYMGCFPEEEREDTRTVRGYIDDRLEAAKNNTESEGIFKYLVTNKDGRPRGMISFDLLPYETEDGKKGVVAFEGYIAVQPSYRNQGIGRALTQGMTGAVGRYVKDQKLEDAVSFLEVEKPQTDASDDMRDKIRPNFHRKHSKAMAMVTIDDQGYAKVVAYAQPGMKEKGKTGAVVPMLPVAGQIKDGKLQNTYTDNAQIIGEDAKIRVAKDSLNSMSAEQAYAVIKTVLEGYADDPETYSPRQVNNIMKTVRKSLAGQDKVYLVPIADTKPLDFPTGERFYKFFK